jgi:hypothetical protein
MPMTQDLKGTHPLEMGRRFRATSEFMKLDQHSRPCGPAGLAAVATETPVARRRVFDFGQRAEEDGGVGPREPCGYERWFTASGYANHWSQVASIRFERNDAYICVGCFLWKIDLQLALGLPIRQRSSICEETC